MPINQSPIVKVGLRLQLRFPSGAKLFYQNYHPTPLLIAGATYQPLGMDFAGVPNFLELDNTGITANLPNSSALRDIFQANDGLKKTMIELTQIFIDEPGATPVRALLQVRSSSIDYPSISLELESPLDAIGGQIPNKYFVEKDFPELPTRVDANIR
jgi:hypothetical protein